MESCVRAFQSERIRPLLRSSRDFSHCWRLFEGFNKKYISATSKATAENRHSSLKFDYLALKCSTLDLQERFVPSKVEDVIQYHDQCIALRLRNIVEFKWLTISWSPSFAHIGMLATEPRRGSASELYGLGESIRRNLKGMILVGVSIPEKWERVAKISFSERLEEPPRFYMYVEIMNKHSNLILCNLDDEILFAANQIGTRKSSERQIQTKRRYRFPPKVGGLPPDDYQSFLDWKECLLSCASFHNTWDINYCISRSFRGIGPGQAREIIDKSNLPPEIGMNVMNAEHWASLFSTWLEWLDAIEDDAPSYCFPTSGGVSILRTIESEFPDLTPLEFFGNHFYSSLESDEMARLLTYLKKSVSKQKDRQMKKLASLQKQADASVSHCDIKLCGDLIMSNLHLLVPGTSFIDLENWETGKMEHIKLDPTRSAIQNAEMYYKRAKKAKRGATKIAPLIDESRSEINFLEENEVLLDIIVPENSESIDLLHQIESDLASLGYIKKRGMHKTRETSSRKKKIKGPNLRFMTSPNGFEVIVGRSSQENDTITMSMAKSGDVWMHARGYPGAHVLLRCSQSVKAVAKEDLKFAADIAAFYSKGSALSKVDVIMADKKNISKPRGARPGQVLVHKEKVIVGEPGNAIFFKE